jgi:hypothetical protein
MTQRNLQIATFIVGVGMVILTIGFYFQMPWATSLWMWEDGRLTYIFIASITAAVAAPMFWIGWAKEWGAAAGGGINLLIQAAGIALFLLQLTLLENQGVYWGHILMFAAFAAANVVIFLRSRTLPYRDERPIPAPVRYSFVVFVILLAIAAVALLTKTPNIFPWTLKPETSVVIGWVFAGTVIYFSYPFLRSGWSNAVGQLLGFLAYDLILIVPFLGHFGSVAPENRLSLIVYTGVLIYSGSLAVYYLFVNKATRIVGAGQILPDAEASG